jgi:hypothetical protein
MKYKPDQYITSDSYGVYYIRIAIPEWLRSAFGGKKTLVRSLNTSDLRVARRKRDVIADEYHRVREIAEPPKPDSLQDDQLSPERGEVCQSVTCSKEHTDKGREPGITYSTSS